MNGILFIDTETNGLPNNRLPLNHKSQPHVVQLAALLTDQSANIVGSFVTLIRPHDWIIPVEVSRVHGITTERCREYGIPMHTALNVVYGLACRSTMVVAHNIEFDEELMNIASERYGTSWCPSGVELFCTAEAATPVVKMPPTERMIKAGFTGFKKPKLSECIESLFGEKLDGEHDAMVDVIGCKRVFFELRNRSNPIVEMVMPEIPPSFLDVSLVDVSDLPI